MTKKSTNKFSGIPDADVSFCIALIPAEPLYSSVARASSVVSAHTENMNIIDNQKYPTHVSLMLCGTSQRGLPLIKKGIKTLYLTKEPVIATQIFSDKRGFIGIDLIGKPLQSLHDQLLPLLSKVMKFDPSLRPHLQERWLSLNQEQQDRLRQYGTYKIFDRFNPHISVALVKQEYVKQMEMLVRAEIIVPTVIRFNALQLVDIGHNNEQWDVLYNIKF